MVLISVDPKSISFFHITNYLNRNKGVRTVESELEEALYRLGVIADYNYGDLKKIGFSRATRTDKKVHALQNVFSCKAHLRKNFNTEEFRVKLN
jgi:tRNA pseudouridine(38-40) synthase